MTDDDKHKLHPATAAERLVQHLDRSGYVLMKRAAAVALSTSGHKHPNGG